MTNDLIRRETLKEEIQRIVKEESPLDEKWATGLRYSIKIINNAPAIHPEECEGCPYCPNSNSGIPIGVE